MRIEDIYKKYSAKIDRLDLELLIAAAISKSREFVLAHPEYRLNSLEIENLKLKISRRRRGEPLAYILGQKEFYGLNFKVNQYTLIPRPETELLVEKVLELNPKKTTIIDVGTGSGNIIISLAKKLKRENKFIALDISKEALAVAKQNAKTHKVGRGIEFINSNFLDRIIRDLKFKSGNSKILILANLPYLSKKIYAATSKDIQKYEPKSALISGKLGLAHYKTLFEQIGLLSDNGELRFTIFIEFGTEQKKAIQKLVRDSFPDAKTTFHKDLANMWRLCQISLI